MKRTNYLHETLDFDALWGANLNDWKTEVFLVGFDGFRHWSSRGLNHLLHFEIVVTAPVLEPDW